jgi:hypothetical protein
MTVQSYIDELKRQLDLLYQLVENIQQGVAPDHSLGEVSLTSVMPKIDAAAFGLDMSVGGESFYHKDILFDESLSLEGHGIAEEHLSPELQVKRLTAQLTVAYKRIAQLEEQLLSQQHPPKGHEYTYSSSSGLFG